MKWQRQKARTRWVAESHPERGRLLHKERDDVTRYVYGKVWVSDDSHPLGGYEGTVILNRRVNLRKDELPVWVRERPLYEFVKERKS
jgi:hypothetical protein